MMFAALNAIPSFNFCRNVFSVDYTGSASILTISNDSGYVYKYSINILRENIFVSLTNSFSRLFHLRLRYASRYHQNISSS